MTGGRGRRMVLFPDSILITGLFSGHGRSVAVTCAFLVALGVAEDWKNAEKVIREKRPYIRLNALHRRALEEWSRHTTSAPTKNGGTDRTQ